MANPPITVGPFTNVPAPGSAIASAWAQTISDYTWKRIKSRFGGINDDAATLRVQMYADVFTGTVDSNGLALVTFTQPFGANPIVVASNNVFPGNGIIAMAFSVNTTDFTIGFYNAAGPASGSRSASGGR